MHISVFRFIFRDRSIYKTSPKQQSTLEFAILGHYREVHKPILFGVVAFLVRLLVNAKLVVSLGDEKFCMPLLISLISCAQQHRTTGSTNVKSIRKPIHYKQPCGYMWQGRAATVTPQAG